MKAKSKKRLALRGGIYHDVAAYAKNVARKAKRDSACQQHQQRSLTKQWYE